jgi:hypothetical protein
LDEVEIVKDTDPRDASQEVAPTHQELKAGLAHQTHINASLVLLVVPTAAAADMFTMLDSLADQPLSSPMQLIAS